METITFECEIITPMFLAGADGVAPELRSPSIKGALRFWWRAMNGHLDLDTMRQAEMEIFGSTKQRSKVIIRSNITETQEGGLNRSDDLTGRDYLMYSVFPPMNEKSAFLSGKFIVHLMSSDLHQLKSAAFCFWLLSNLGGLGTRSRRGSGRFMITKCDGNDWNFSFYSNSNDLNQFTQYLTSNIETIKRHFGIASNNNITDFPCFKSCSIYLLITGKPKSEEALNDIGLQYMNFRRRRNPDYTSVKEFIQLGTRPTTIEKSVFGLPIGYRFRSLHGNSATIEAKTTSRSASSLFLEVIKVGTQFYPLIINFNSKLLDTIDRLKISSREQRNNTQNPNQPTINLKNVFISSLVNKVQIL